MVIGQEDLNEFLYDLIAVYQSICVLTNKK